MNNELGFHAYILLGNALNYVLRGGVADADAALGAPFGAIASLAAKIEPLSPKEIVATSAALSPEDGALLARCCHLCLETMNDEEVASALGLSRGEAREVLRELALEHVSVA